MGGLIRNGKYASRTGTRDKVGYSKHTHQGCCVVARYKRVSRHTAC